MTGTCAHCGQETKFFRSSQRTYCSRACQAAHNKKARVCAACGVVFVPESLGSTKFCSEACKGAARRRYEETKLLQPPKRKYGVYVTRFCKICGERMKLYPSNQDQLYCSRRCYGLSVGLRQKGDKHHNWKGGVSVPRDEVRKSLQYKEWRTKVFARDEFTCQSCFCKSGELRAHHMVAYKEAPKLRLKVTNGITLCAECHRQWHVFDRKGTFEGLEKKLQSDAVKLFKEAGFFVFNVHGHSMQTAGIPDTLMCFCGLFVAVEYKVAPNFLTPLQKVQAKAIKAAGGLVYMVRSVDDVDRIIDEVRLVALGAG